MNVHRVLSDGVFLGIPGTGAQVAARLGAGPVAPANPYWAEHGRTYEDTDGFRVVLVPARWPALASATDAPYGDAVDTVRVDGLEVAYDRVGSGPPVVFVHGAASDSRVWRPQLAALAEEFTVIAWDEPGSGRSSDVPEHFELADYADCLAALIGALGLGPAHVAGLSWGGTVALELYRRHAGLVTSLILADTYAGWKGSLPAAEVSARVEWIERMLAGPDDMFDRTLPGLFAHGPPPEFERLLDAIDADVRPDSMRIALSVMAHVDQRELLPRVAVPTLLVWGELDARSPLSVARQFEQAIRGSRLVVIPGAGHMTNLEQPERFNDAIREFCRAHPPASAAGRAALMAEAGAALGRRAWPEAQALYERVLALGPSPEGLEGFAFARWWQDDVDAAIAARERAYALRRERGETVEAARVAGFLAWDHGAMRGVNAVANGWLQRARRLLEGREPSAEFAWLPLIEASFHLDTDPSEVLRLSTEAAEHARAHGGLDIAMTARTLQGLALVSLGRVAEGMRLLDEGTAAATAGELYDPLAIGSCCCNMIIASERARDFERAGQWCEQLAAFCDRTGHQPLLALCRAHHGTVRMMRGEWTEAEQDLAWAADALTILRPPLAGYARARLAQLRRRQGRPREARALAEQAGTHVLAPLVRAELSLDEDDPQGALGHAERYRRGLGEGQPIESAAALELLVPIRVRLGRLGEARDAHAELAAIAGAVGTDQLRAVERHAAGRVALAERDRDAARTAFEDAIDLFLRCVTPFEAALARLELARALADQDRAAAGLEHALAARGAFEHLGAARAVRAADRLAGKLGGRSQAAARAGMTRREVEVLALVAQGLSNRQIAEQLVVSEHTVHRHLANLYARLGVSTRAAAVALASERGLLA